MKIKIKRVDQTLPLPEYHTPGSVAFDLYAREGTTLLPKEIKLVPANLVMETPAGYMLMVASRSSTPLKKGLLLANGVGIIDQDYCGPEDELKLLFYNFTDRPVTIERGERVAQALFVKIEKGEWEETDNINGRSRGGYGSTG